MPSPLGSPIPATQEHPSSLRLLSDKKAPCSLSTEKLQIKRMSPSGFCGTAPLSEERGEGQTWQGSRDTQDPITVAPGVRGSGWVALAVLTQLAGQRTPSSQALHAQLSQRGKDWGFLVGDLGTQRQVLPRRFVGENEAWLLFPQGDKYP